MKKKRGWTEHQREAFRATIAAKHGAGDTKRSPLVQEHMGIPMATFQDMEYEELHNLSRTFPGLAARLLHQLLRAGQ